MQRGPHQSPVVCPRLHNHAHSTSTPSPPNDNDTILPRHQAPSPPDLRLRLGLRSRFPIIPLPIQPHKARPPAAASQPALPRARIHRRRHGHYQLRGAGPRPGPPVRRLLHIPQPALQAFAQLAQEAEHRHQEPRKVSQEGGRHGGQYCRGPRVRTLISLPKHKQPLRPLD